MRCIGILNDKVAKSDVLPAQCGKSQSILQPHHYLTQGDWDKLSSEVGLASNPVVLKSLM